MKCEFCGKDIEIKHVSYLRFGIPVPCDCEKAVALRKREEQREWSERWNNTYQQAVKAARIPSRFQRYDSYGDGGGLYLYGRQGRGKTEMACGALRGYIRSGIIEADRMAFFATKSARFVNVPEWLMEMRKTYDVRGESESDLMESYAGVGMLCLDDLGKGQMTPWAIERIYTLLDMRYREDRPTVITSQYDGNGLCRVLTEKGDREHATAIWSRIQGMCKIGEIRGRDWRTSE